MIIYRCRGGACPRPFIVVGAGLAPALNRGDRKGRPYTFDIAAKRPLKMSAFTPAFRLLSINSTDSST